LERKHSFISVSRENPGEHRHERDKSEPNSETGGRRRKKLDTKQFRNRSQQLTRVGVRGLPQNFFGSSYFYKFTGTHDSNPHRQLRHDRQAVRNENVGQAKLALKILQQKQHLSADGDIQCGDRLIGNNQFRPQDQRAQFRCADAGRRKIRSEKSGGLTRGTLPRVLVASVIFEVIVVNKETCIDIRKYGEFMADLEK
jgi:hypothetical protein